LYGPSNNLLAVLSARLANGLQAALADKRRLLAVVFVLALVMRLVFLANLLRIEGQRYPYASDDGTSYDAYALKGSSDPAFFIRESPHKYMLFYSLPMAVIYGIFGHNYAALGIIQSVIGAFLCCLTFILADRITGSAAISLLASLGVAVDSALIHLTTTINTEALYIPFIVLTVFFLLRYREGERDRAAMAFLLAAALTLALAAFMRVVGILFAAFVGPWIIVWGRRYAPDAVLKRLRDAVLFIVTTLLVILPITCVNYINTHKICLIYVTGSDLWATGSSTWGEGMVPSNKELIELGMRDPVTDLKGSLEAFFARPAAILKAYGRIIPKRMMNLYLWPNFGLFDPIYLLNPSQRPTRYASNLEFYSLCLFFASFFVFIFSKLKTYLKSLTLLVILFYTVFHGIFFLSMSPRYGSPMRPFLYIIISFCLYKIFAAGFSVLTGKQGAA
jgi:hypothetical protein